VQPISDGVWSLTYVIAVTRAPEVRNPNSTVIVGRRNITIATAQATFLSHIYEFDTQFLYYSFLLLATRQDHATSSTNTRTRPQAIESTHDTMADKLGSLKPQKKIELYSGNYFAACTLGGIIACGPTHTMVTPLDLVRIHIYIAAAPTTLRARNH